MNKVLLIVGVLLIAGLGYLHYDSQLQLLSARQEVAGLRQLVSQLEVQVTDLDKKVKALEGSSVEGIVREANGAILEGWQSLVDTVEQEIKRARESIQRPAGSKSSPPQDPNLVSPAPAPSDSEAI